MRQIKASEVKPGMTIRWTEDGTTRELTVAQALQDGCIKPSMQLQNDAGFYEYTALDAEVTVLSEPAPVQPEEPTAFGAKVRVRDGRFVRLDDYAAGVVPWSEKGTGAWWTWDDLCEMGPVTVVPDQGWAVPADTPEVPERIEKWPEDDEALRPYPWRDRDGYIWRYGSNSHGDGWICGYVRRGKPFYGPWDRVADA